MARVPISFSLNWFLPDSIRLATLICFRVTTSLRDVDDFVTDGLALFKAAKWILRSSPIHKLDQLRASKLTYCRRVAVL
jgi:hypothetical protein